MTKPVEAICATDDLGFVPGATLTSSPTMRALPRPLPTSASLASHSTSGRAATDDVAPAYRARQAAGAARACSHRSGGQSARVAQIAARIARSNSRTCCWAISCACGERPRPIALRSSR
jgi:hypothetical protein